MTETTARHVAAPQGHGRLYIVLAVGALLALGLAYWAGRWQMGSDFSAYRDQQAERQAAAAQTTQQLQAQNATLRDQVSLLEGRRQLHLALLALDARNFGLAKGHLRRAATELEGGAGTVPAGNQNQRQALERQLRSTALVATEDFSRQRQQILAWTRQWDALLPQEVTQKALPPSLPPPAAGAP